MIRKVFFSTIIPLGTLFLMASCDYEVIEPVDVQVTNVSFSNDIIPIFEGSCALSGCHDATTKIMGIDFSAANAYQTIQSKSLVTAGDPDNSKLYVKISTSGTHDGRASVSDQGYIKQWITEGAKDN